MRGRDHRLPDKRSKARIKQFLPTET
jgi:hypothetical protein